MKIYDVDQGSDDWWSVRYGIPTASEFNRIITKRGTVSEQFEGYCNRLVAERLIGGRGDVPFESQWMNRGKYHEDDAVLYYEMQRDRTTDPGGFVTNDEGSVGCSPDRLVYIHGKHDKPDGGLEVKCPSPEVHMGFVFSDRGALDHYNHQVQGCLWVTGLEWWDVLSYHPKLPPSLLRIEPDLMWREIFVPQIRAFLDELHAKCLRVQRMGYTFPERPRVKPR